MAEHVRTAFLELCGIDESTMKTLAGEPYNKPLGHWPIVKYLRGKLIGDGDELAPKSNAYPFMKWKYTLKDVSVDDKGQLRVKYDETFTAEIAEGIQFRPLSYEAWRAE